MFWLAFAAALELMPADIAQGQVARLQAPIAATSARIAGRTLPLFIGSDGKRAGLVPVRALEPTGRLTVEALDASGAVLATAILHVRDGRFKKQNVTLGRSVTGLKPAPGEMETVAALRASVTPVRFWAEPFVLPTAGCLTSPYGVQRLHNGKATGNYHAGIDQRGAAGVPVRAIAAGSVKIVRNYNVHGGTVGIDHGQGVTSIYLHMSGFATREGARVEAGEVVGYVGSTGRSTAPHLHWALNVHGTPVNPLQWIEVAECPVARVVKKKR